MAASNTYSWMTPDPFKPPLRSLNHARLIGELQYFYKNNLRNTWIHPSAYANPSVPGYGTTDHPPNYDPNGDSKNWKNSFEADGDILSGGVSAVTGITPDASGNHLLGYDALLSQAYFNSLQDTREHTEKTLCQDWDWIAPSGKQSIHTLSYTVDPNDGAGQIITSAPHFDWINYLREVPVRSPVSPYDINGATSDFSDFNGEVIGDLYNVGPADNGNSTHLLGATRATIPSTTPNYAREVFGFSKWFTGRLNDSAAGIFADRELIETHSVQPTPNHFNGTIAASHNDCGTGRVGMNSWTSASDANGDISWEGRLSLPMYKLSPSPLLIPSSQGIPLKSATFDAQAFSAFTSKFVVGPVLTPNMGIRFTIEGTNPPSFVGNGGATDNGTVYIEWRLDLVLMSFASGNPWVSKQSLGRGSFNSLSGGSFPVNTKATIRYGFRKNGNGTTESYPVSKFSSFAQSNITVYPIVDFPQYGGWQIMHAALFIVQTSGTGFSQGGTFTFNPMAIKGIELIFDAW